MLSEKVVIEFDLIEMQELESAVHNQWRASMKRVMSWREKAELGDEGINAPGCWQAAKATENYANRVWALYEKVSAAKLLTEPEGMAEELDDWDIL